MRFAGRFTRLVRRSRAPSSHGSPAPPVAEPATVEEWLAVADNRRALLLFLAFVLAAPLFELGLDTLFGWAAAWISSWD